eukprot:NODE_767_length_4389_cov_0.039860.p4 type:complete len:105 gc:universal NODE_767_length_4389_cov_0.039860:763-449(-)
MQSVVSIKHFNISFKSLYAPILLIHRWQLVYHSVLLVIDTLADAFLLPLVAHPSLSTSSTFSIGSSVATFCGILGARNNVESRYLILFFMELTRANLSFSCSSE